MSGYSDQYQQPQQPQQPDYWIPNQAQPADSSYNFDMSAQQDFGQELDFQTFNPNAAGAQQQPYQHHQQQQSGNIYEANPYLNPSNDANMYYKDGAAAGGENFDDFEDEPPLLEELGINPDFILQKIRAEDMHEWQDVVVGEEDAGANLTVRKNRTSFK